MLDIREEDGWTVVDGLYVFARANDMEGHRFSDSVALTLASSEDEAIEKFGRLYAGVVPSEVSKVMFNGKVRVLTDY